MNPKPTKPSSAKAWWERRMHEIEMPKDLIAVDKAELFWKWWTKEVKSFIASELAKEREDMSKIARYIQNHSKPPKDLKAEFQSGWFLGHFDGLERFLTEVAKKVGEKK